MRVLLAKDIRLFRSMKNMMLIIVSMIVVSLITGQKELGALMIQMSILLFGYMGMVTMSYDDFDNGMEFILTLPTTKKLYAIEKYALSIIMIVVSSIVGTGLLLVFDYSIKRAALSIALMVAAVIIFMSINIPLSIKFGSEKTKILTFIICIAFGSFVGAMDSADFNAIVNSDFVRNVMSLGKLQLGIGVGLIVVVILIISCCISIKISENKEY